MALTAPDAADASSPVLGPATLTLAAGKNYTAAAHLNEGGDPSLKLFENNTATTAAGQGRLTVRHIAAAPAVDILAGGAPVIEDLTNPNEVDPRPARRHRLGGGRARRHDGAVLGPADVPIQDGVLTIVYAWGSAEDDNLALAVQTVSGLHSNPGGVPSGNAGYLAQRDAVTSLVAMAGVGALAIAAAAGSAIVVRRRQQAQR